jgi:hypothetical protein
MTTKDDGVLRGFDTGATRDTAEGKLDYEGFLSPAVLQQFARYMNMNRLQSDGKLRDSDNWQKGIPMDVYMKSGYRHFFEWWNIHRRCDKGSRREEIDLVAGITGLMFNCMGYLHEWLKENPEVRFDDDEPTKEMRERQLRVEADREAEGHVEERIPVCSECRALAGEPHFYNCPLRIRFEEATNMAQDSQLSVDVDDYTEHPDPRADTTGTEIWLKTMDQLTDTIDRMRENIQKVNNPAMTIPGEPEEDACTELDEELDDMMDEDQGNCDLCRWEGLSIYEHPCDCCAGPDFKYFSKEDEK